MPLLLRHRLLLLLLLFVAASQGDPAGDNYNTSMCLLKSYTCGNVTISYPFYHAEDTRVINRYNNSYCGYPGLGILCEDGKPILQLNGSDKYTVKSINYGSGANVSLADSEVLDSSSGCPRVDHNVTLPQDSWLSFPDSTVDYLVFFLGCTFTRYLFRPPIEEITCGNFYTGPGLSFVLPKRDVPSGNWSQACEQVIEVPVLKYDPIDPRDPAWRNGEFANFLRRGFQLVWTKTTGPCNRCERSNGRCSHNQAGQFMGCLCPNGRVDDRDCSAGYFNKRRKTYIIASTLSTFVLCLLLFAFFLGHKKYRSKKISKETPRIESFLQKNGTLHPKRYTYAEVKRMTNSFAVKLGQGGFGAVY